MKQNFGKKDENYCARHNLSFPTPDAYELHRKLDHGKEKIRIGFSGKPAQYTEYERMGRDYTRVASA